MKNVFSILPAAGLCAAVLLLAGCKSNTVNTVAPAQTTAQRQMIADHVIMTDGSLAKSVRVMGVNVATDNEGFLKIQVEVQNTTKSRKLFTYRVEWFDEKGMIITLPTAAAIPRSLEGKETSYLTATAPTIMAKDFKIKFLSAIN
jgi:uncharacterized protein YcfL